MDLDTLLKPLKDLFNDAVVPTLLVVATAVFLILGIINGIRMAKATTDEEKTKARNALLGLLLGVIITIAALVLIPTLIAYLKETLELGGTFV